MRKGELETLERRVEASPIPEALPRAELLDRTTFPLIGHDRPQGVPEQRVEACPSAWLHWASRTEHVWMTGVHFPEHLDNRPVDAVVQLGRRVVVPPGEQPVDRTQLLERRHAVAARSDTRRGQRRAE